MGEGWGISVDDTRAGSHPLDVARADETRVAHAVPVAHAAPEHVRDRLDASVRVPGKSRQVLIRILGAEEVEEEERIEEPRLAVGEEPNEPDSRPVHGFHALEGPDNLALAHVLPPFGRL